MGRPRYDAEKLMKVTLFAFMENGYSSLRNIEKLCKTDIRYIWLLDGEKAPSFVTVSNFLREYVGKNIEALFADINKYLFAEEGVDLSRLYIDGTKIEANANKYTWVWKKSCLKSRDKVYRQLTDLIVRDQIQDQLLDPSRRDLIKFLRGSPKTLVTQTPFFTPRMRLPADNNFHLDLCRQTPDTRFDRRSNSRIPP